MLLTQINLWQRKTSPMVRPKWVEDSRRRGDSVSVAYASNQALFHLGVRGTLEALLAEL
jgi:hypothetical protein